MAYIFPVNPFDGQLYPVPAVPGALQYQWNAALNSWLIYSPLGVQSVSGLLPIVVSNGNDDAVVSILPATINTAGAMTAADKAKLDSIPADAGSGTVTQINTGAGLAGGPITTAGQINVTPATTSSLGGVKIGSNITVDPDGTIGVATTLFGVTSINVGPGLIGNPSPIINTGTISAAIATRLSVGSVRVGTGLNIAQDGTLSVGGSLQDVAVPVWGTIKVSAGAAPWTFTVDQGYNVSSVVWIPGSQPRVRINFQNPLVDNKYGVALTARVYSHNGNQQENVILNYSFKTTTYVEALCAALETADNTTNTSTTAWNAWNRVAEFDIIISDLASFP